MVFCLPSASTSAQDHHSNRRRRSVRQWPFSSFYSASCWQWPSGRRRSSQHKQSSQWNRLWSKLSLLFCKHKKGLTVFFRVKVSTLVNQLFSDDQASSIIKRREGTKRNINCIRSSDLKTCPLKIPFSEANWCWLHPGPIPQLDRWKPLFKQWRMSRPRVLQHGKSWRSGDGKSGTSW